MRLTTALILYMIRYRHFFLPREIKASGTFGEFKQLASSVVEPRSINPGQNLASLKGRWMLEKTYLKYVIRKLHQATGNQPPSSFRDVQYSRITVTWGYILSLIMYASAGYFVAQAAWHS